jgi:hypothetical protein
MPQHRSMRRLREVLTLVLQTTKHGGRLLQRDDATLILSNYNVMNVYAIDIIRDQFPHAEINIQADVGSSSGYVVIFVLRDQSSVLTSSACFQLSLLLVLAWGLFWQQAVRDLVFGGWV